jgi:AraC-like DNA-binding protein
MQLGFSTDGLAPGRTFDAWAETLDDLCGMKAQMSGTDGFRASISGQAKGSFLTLSVDADSYSAARGPNDIARKRWDGYWIYREASPGMRIVYAGRESVIAHGDLIVGDADIPFESTPMARCTHQVSIVPRALLDPHLPRSAGPCLTRLSGRNGVGALAARYFDTLVRELPTIPDQSIEPVLDTLCRLIGVAAGVPTAEQPDAIQAGRFAAAVRYIDQHLTNPDLSPAHVAGALGISVRALHLAFEPESTSFTRQVLRRRLEECRTALIANPARPVIDIAFAWGFGSLSGFYRAFQAAFGMSPGDLRTAATLNRHN